MQTISSSSTPTMRKSPGQRRPSDSAAMSATSARRSVTANAATGRGSPARMARSRSKARYGVSSASLGKPNRRQRPPLRPMAEAKARTRSSDQRWPAKPKAAKVEPALPRAPRRRRAEAGVVVLHGDRPLRDAVAAIHPDGREPAGHRADDAADGASDEPGRLQQLEHPRDALRLVRRVAVRQPGEPPPAPPSLPHQGEEEAVVARIEPQRVEENRLHREGAAHSTPTRPGWKAGLRAASAATADAA